MRNIYANRPGLIYHIETPNGIINISVSEIDKLGRSIDCVEILEAFEDVKLVSTKHLHQLIRFKPQ